jgi:hypothetical protein
MMARKTVCASGGCPERLLVPFWVYHYGANAYSIRRFASEADARRWCLVYGFKFEGEAKSGRERMNCGTG